MPRDGSASKEASSVSARRLITSTSFERKSADASWFGVRSSIFGAARFLYRSEFHKFDAGAVGIVNVQLPFSAAADMGFFGELEASVAKTLFGGVDVGYADGDVVHDAADALVGVGRGVDHEFEPVGAVGDLHGDPVGYVVLHATVPVGAKAEDVFVEVLGGDAIANDEACMDKPHPTQ